MLVSIKLKCAALSQNNIGIPIEHSPVPPLKNWDGAGPQASISLSVKHIFRAIPLINFSTTFLHLQLFLSDAKIWRLFQQVKPQN